MEYRCPHCGGNANPIPGAEDVIKCEGAVHCQFMADAEEFEHIGTEALSAEFTGCKATPAPSHIILYHGTNHVEHFWDEDVAKTRYDILEGDWDCNIYVKQ